MAAGTKQHLEDFLTKHKDKDAVREDACTDRLPSVAT